jgi:hypothetical protein
VNCTGKWLDEEKTRPNPNYVKAVRELEAAKVHFAEYQKFLKLTKTKGFIQNYYAKTCVKTGVEVPEGLGFAKKNKAGKWETFSYDYVAQLFGLDKLDLPEIEKPKTI